MPPPSHTTALPPHATATAPAVVARQKADDHVDDPDDAVDDGHEDRADAVHDAHDGAADGAEDGLDLLATMLVWLRLEGGNGERMGGWKVEVVGVRWAKMGEYVRKIRRRPF